MESVIVHWEDNISVCKRLIQDNERFDFIYADMIYEDRNFDWVDLSTQLLSPNGIFIVQTDYHTVAEMKLALDKIGLSMVNWCIYLNDWGGTPKKAFPKKHDDILIYSNGENYKFYSSRIQIPKVTAGTRFDKKGTGLKTPPDVFYDHPSFSTMSKERVRDETRGIRWQKPLWLMDRLLLPFTDEGDKVLDLFMGSASLGVSCIRNNREYVGIEAGQDACLIACDRLNKEIDVNSS